MSISTKRKNACREYFKNHHATLIINTDRFAIIDWQNEKDEYGGLYINYIVDKLKGTLTVNGSCGASVADYSQPMTISELRTAIIDEDDYADKLRVTTDRFEYNADTVIEILKSIDDPDHIIKFNDNDLSDIDAFWRATKWDLYDADRKQEEINNAVINSRIVAMPVFLWSVGFDMACEQLGIKPAHP